MEAVKTFSIDLPPKTIVDVMRNPDFIKQAESAREETKAVDVRQIEENEASHRYDILLTTYSHSLKGIDKKKTEKSISAVTWDLANLRGQWVWSGQHGPRVNIDGGYAIKPKAKGSELTLNVNIQIKVPVIGKVIEKKVQQGFLSEWPNFIERITRFAKDA